MKSFIKAVGLFLSLAIILPTFSTTVSALAASDFSTDNKLSVLSEDAIDSGNCGEALLWSLDSDGTLVIEGKGPMADYRSGNQPWSANMNSIKTLVIEEGVTSIGNNAFYNCSSISSDLVIPDSVTSIGNYAFYRCTGLNGTLKLSENLTSIGDYAFYDCSNIQGELVIPHKLTTVEDRAFENMDGITSVVIGASVKNIYSSFYGCDSIKEMTFLGTTPSSSNPFYGIGTALETVYVPAESYGEYSTAYKTYLPTGVRMTTIGAEGDFLVNDGVLTAYLGEGGEVAIPNGVNVIGTGAFQNCATVTKITMPDSVTKIESYAFYNCSELAEIELSTALEDIEENAFRNCVKLESIELPAGLKTIGNSAFRNCDGVKGGLTIPSSVTAIGEYAFAYSTGFDGKLTIEANDGLTIGGYAFYETTFSAVEIGNGTLRIGNNAFYNCSSISSDLVIPDSVTSIGNYAFYRCTGLNGTLKLSENLTSIGDYAFYDCSNIQGELVIPHKLTTVEDRAFENMDGITSVVIGASVKNIYSSFYGCDSIKEMTFLGTTPSSSNPFYGIGTALETVYVPADNYDAYVAAYSGYVGESVVFESNFIKAKVTGFTATNVYSKTVVLSWNAHISPDVIGYAVKRDNVTIGTTSSLSFVDRTMEAGEQYLYTVYGYTADGETTSRAVLRVSSRIPNIIDIKTDNVYDKIGVSNGKVYIYVKNDKNLVPYEDDTYTGTLYYISGDERIPIGNIADEPLPGSSSIATYVVQWDIAQLPDGDYTVVFVFTDIDGTSSEYSDVFNIDRSVPSKINNVIGAYDGKDICLSWDMPAEEDTAQYRVYRKEQTENAYKLVATISDRDILVYRDNDVSYDKSYQYYVTGVNYFGQEGTAYDIINIRMPITPKAPLNLTASSTQEYIELRWTVPDLMDASGYFAIYRSNAIDGEYVRVNTTSYVNYIDTTVKNNKEYYYYVKTVDTYGAESEATEVVSCILLKDTTKPGISSFAPVENTIIYKSVTLKVAVYDNYELSHVTFMYKAQGGDYTLIEEIKAASNSTVLACDWDVSELSAGNYTVKIYATDSAGNVSDSIDINYIVEEYEPPVAPKLTGVGGYKNVSISWSYNGISQLVDFYTVYMKQENGEFLPVTTTYALSCSYVAQAGEYTYKVVVTDKLGATAESDEIILAVNEEDTEAPFAIINAKNIIVSVNKEFMLNGSLSMDNEGVVSYEWDFGDGYTQSGEVITHKYTSVGSYTVSLTVKDAAGNASTDEITVQVIDPAVNSEYRTVEVTVNDEDGATVDNMQVQFLSLDDASALPIVISTDANGVASTVLKCGNYEISAMNSDAISAEKVITVKPYTLRSIDPTAQKESITVRTRLGYLVGAVNVKQLSYGEIIAAGIDVNAPGNKNIFEFEVKYKYRVNEYDYEDEIIKYYYNGYGSFIGYHTFCTAHVPGTGCGGCTSAYTGYRFVPLKMDKSSDSDEEDEFCFLVLNGSISFLKQIFEVDLILANTSYSDWIENCTATINLPKGLSLAAMLNNAQSSKQYVSSESAADGTIYASDQGIAKWYIVGDNPGLYDITVDVSGTYYPQPTEDFNLTFVTAEPIEVLDYTQAISVCIEGVPTNIEKGDKATLTLCVTNISNYDLHSLELYFNTNLGASDRQTFNTLPAGMSARVSVEVTFSFSAGNADEVWYQLVEAEQFIIKPNIKPTLKFLEEESESQIGVDITLWDEYEKSTQTWINQIDSLIYSCGNFQWEKANGNSLSVKERTDFDEIHMKVSVKNKVINEGTVLIPARDVMVTFTAPEGFSFEKNAIVNEYVLNVGYLAANALEDFEVVLYPIYTEEFSSTLDIMYSVSSDIYSKYEQELNVVSIERNPNEGVIAFADTSKTVTKELWASYFESSSYKYSEDLAMISLLLSSLEYCTNEEIEESLLNLGFESITINTDASQYAVNYSVCKKKMIIDGQVVVLIAAPIRGTITADEWIGNVSFGSGENHESFYVSTWDISSTIDKYYVESVDYQVKLLLCGHSRGAAVANLLAADLIDKKSAITDIEKENIYTYTFATPNVTRNENVSNTKYNCIFNIIHYNDLVTMLPLKKVMNYYKYGLTFAFPHDGSDLHKANISKVRSVYKEYRNGAEYNELTEIQRIMICNSLANAIIGGWKNKLSACINLVDLVMAAVCVHTPTSYYAWLSTVPNLEDYEYSWLDYKAVYINCPVNVEVYDEENNLVGRIVNNEVDTSIKSEIALTVIRDSKVVYLPGDKDYTFKVTGYDNGTMSYTVIEYTDEEKSRVINYFDLPVIKNQSINVEVENGDDQTASKYTVVLQDSSTVDADSVLTKEQFDNTLVSVSVKGQGVVYGQGYYTEGELVILIADSSDATFVGWYIGGEKVSSDEIYTLVCGKDAVPEAVFDEGIGILGDVNGDGNVDNLDAAIILKYDAGIISADDLNLAVADVDGDGQVSSLDAARVLKFDVGLISEL